METNAVPVPEGWELVKVDIPKAGEWYLDDRGGAVSNEIHLPNSPRYIIRSIDLTKKVGPSPCSRCGGTGELIISGGAEYPGSSGKTPDGGGSIAECPDCQWPADKPSLVKTKPDPSCVRCRDSGFIFFLRGIEHPGIFEGAQPEGRRIISHSCPTCRIAAQVPMAGGKISSSKGPSFHLIPTVALAAIADRFEEGVKRKPPGQAWNAVSDNQSCLLDKELAIERLSHVIDHALKLRDQLVRGVAPREESMKQNASAIMWGGCFAVCVADAMDKILKEQI